MEIEVFPVGPFQCNCAILTDPQSGDAIVIDPGDEADSIIQKLRARGLRVRHLLHTHAHLDHVGATADLRAALGGTICLHRDDLFLYDNLAMQSALLKLPTPKVAPVDHYLEDGDEVALGGLVARAIFTPGHTPGSLCFLVEEKGGNLRSVLFSGDTLFAGSIGRTDLWGGDYGAIMASIRERLMPLDLQLPVCPGHGPMTTIGDEKRHNPFLQDRA